MSELDWQPPPGGGTYSQHAGVYSVCKVGSAVGTTFECWIGREQHVVGLATGKQARGWCQRHHDNQEIRNVDAQPTSL